MSAQDRSASNYVSPRSQRIKLYQPTIAAHQITSAHDRSAIKVC